MNKKQGIIVCIFGIFILSNMASIFSADPTNKPLYVKETYMIEMRDGIHLATDVYLPDEISNLRGAILVRTPYNKDWSSEIGELADVGWPTIVQDMRGRFASEGTDRIFRNAHTDGPDTLEWIASQNWSNGKIATFGGSALGINQYYMAGANPENLACQYIQVATPNLHNDMIYQGGQFRQALVERWLEGQQSPFALTELIEHENYTLDYWTNTSLEDNWGDVHVPAIHIGGWYDCFTQGTIDGFLGYQHLGGDGAKGHSKLIMGPWIHNGGRVSGELTYPENADPSFSFELFIDMFYEYAMDGDYSEVYDFDGWPAVSYYVMGDVEDISAPGNEWRYACDWPIPSYEAEWYFSSTGELQRAFPDDDALTYLYDPSDPIPTVGGQNVCLPQGSYDQSDVEQRDDVLVFTSDTITEPYEATGPIKARLFVSSDCPDTDFTVKLTDVYPDGRSMLITDGILRMRNRNGCDHWEFMEPGEVYEIEVDLWSTSYIWNTGHKIRVDISSSNYPRFLANPNTADGIYKNTTYNVAHNTLYLSSIRPSCIVLPEVEQVSPSIPPNKPDTPFGPISGKNGQDYNYSSSAIDPEGDNISLLFDWGDGTSSGWTELINSGDELSLSHSWSIGNYSIRVKAKDITGAQSEWSDPLPITMPKNKRVVSSLFLRLLERLIERFPIIKQILHLPILANSNYIAVENNYVPNCEYNDINGRWGHCSDIITEGGNVNYIGTNGIIPGIHFAKLKSTILGYPTVDWATEYYVDSVNGSDTNDGTSESEPWQTLAPVHAQNFNLGNVIHFKCGSSWTGGLTIDESGVDGNPIIFTTYGAGNKPIFRFPGADWWGNAITINADWVVVEGLLVRDARVAGVYISDGSNNNIVQDVEATNVGIGFAVYGRHNLITRNYVHDLTMVVNTPGGDDDGGAVGVWLYNSSNEVSYNTMINCIAPSYDYGVDGGVVEWYGYADNCYVHHNWGEGCDGFLEIGGGSCKNTIMAYNVLINNGGCYMHMTGPYASDIENFRFEHNTIIETRDDWLWTHIGFGGDPTSSTFLMRNNIFYLGKFDRISNKLGFTHDNNIYHLLYPNGTQIGFTLDPSEILADPLFVDLAGSDFHLQSGSPAIDSGVDLEYSLDFDNNPVPIGAAPDIGAFEFQGNQGLRCNGALSWNNIKPGSTVTDSFTIENAGDPGSNIDWCITEWPSWGTWTFIPISGDNLNSEDGPVTVEVSVVAPDEQNKGFSGSIKIVNKDNIDDFCIVPVSLATPKNKEMISTLFIQFLERVIECFPMLERLLKLPSL